MRIVLSDKLESLLNQEDCKKLKTYFTFINPENYEEYMKFEDFEKKEILNQEEQLIFALVNFVDNFILQKNKCLDIIPVIVNIITKFSKENLAQCFIDENEKIFTSLNKILNIYKKLDIELSLKDFVIRNNNFIKYLIDIAYENYINQINTFDEDIGFKQQAEDSFNTNMLQVFDKINSLIKKSNTTLSSSEENSQLPYIDLTKQFNTIKSELIKEIKENLNFIKNENEESLDEESIKNINSNLKTIQEILENLEKNITNVLEEKLNEVFNFLKENTNNLNDIVNSSLEEFKRQVSELANLDNKIDLILNKENENENKLNQLIENISKIYEIINEEHQEYEKIKEKHNLNVNG